MVAHTLASCFEASTYDSHISVRESTRVVREDQVSFSWFTSKVYSTTLTGYSEPVSSECSRLGCTDGVGSSSGRCFVFINGAATHVAFVSKLCLSWVVTDDIAVSLSGYDIVQR